MHRKRGRPRAVVDFSDQAGSANAEVAGELEQVRPKVEALYDMSEKMDDPACVKEKQAFKKAQKDKQLRITSAKKRVVKLLQKCEHIPDGMQESLDANRALLNAWSDGLDLLSTVTAAVQAERVNLA